MLDTRALKAGDLQGLSPEAAQILARQVLAQFAVQDLQLQQRNQRIEHQERELKFKSAKLEKITFELARLKAWKFGAKTEAMSAEQRRLFEETLAEDEASLQAQLDALQAKLPAQDTPAREPRSKPKRKALPENLRRVEHHHEPENTDCPTPDCGRPMVRIGQDISEKLDIVPAEFFGLAGRVGPEGQPLVRHKASSGRFVSALGTATCTASGPASAARLWFRNPLRRRSSTAACRLQVWWRTR